MWLRGGSFVPWEKFPEYVNRVFQTSFCGLGGVGEWVGEGLAFYTATTAVEKPRYCSLEKFSQFSCVGRYGGAEGWSCSWDSASFRG